MGELFKKENCMTVPNLLSLLRLLLIPVILWLYLGRNDHLAAAAFIGISGLTDVADGYIARRFHQISDLGKLLDPLADKLTQMAMLLCLVTRYAALWMVIGLFAVKELISWILGALVICREHGIRSARWFGKVNTVVLYLVLAALFLFPHIPLKTSDLLIGVSTAVMMITFYLYTRCYVKALLCPNKRAA